MGGRTRLTKDQIIMSEKKENAIRLYLEGIKQGNIDVVDELTGDRYTQHSTGVADGPEGFKDFFRDFLKRTNDRDIRIVRSLEDGRYVFTHAYQNIDNGSAKWITTDMFDTDENNKIVEHWDVIAAYTEVSDTISGNDVILGEFNVKDLDKTESNKALVRMFLTDVIQNGNHDNIEKYISEETYIQHNAFLPNGIDAVRNSLSKKDFRYDFIFHVMGEGNYVVSYSKMSKDNQEYCIFDIFRVENNKIVEHWDNMEPIPPRSEWANTGKF